LKFPTHLYFIYFDYVWKCQVIYKLFSAKLVRKYKNKHNKLPSFRSFIAAFLIQLENQTKFQQIASLLSIPYRCVQSFSNYHFHKNRIHFATQTCSLKKKRNLIKINAFLAKFKISKRFTEGGYFPDSPSPLV